MPKEVNFDETNAVEIGDRVFIHKPEYGALVARIIAKSAGLEHCFAMILVNLLEVYATAATVGMYFALSGSQSKDAVLRSVAKERMEPADYKAFVKLQKGINENPSKWHRNAIAHGRCALSLNGSFVAVKALETLAHPIKRTRLSGELKALKEAPRQDSEAIHRKYIEHYVHQQPGRIVGIEYTVADLEAIVGDMGKLVDQVQRFKYKVKKS